MSQKVRTVLATIALVAAAAALPQTALPQIPKPAKHHIVFQMSEAETEWSFLIAHVTNVQRALANDGGVEIEVVFYGPGINMLRKSNANYAESLKRLSDGGVTLIACQNAMASRGVSSEDLVPFAREVESGIAEIVRKQEAGWSYIK